ncbi:MAG TPA: deoxyribodipyrimidine photo-lyase, partial [Anaerolineales bacterium]
MSSIWWIRRDLRLSDNAALAEAMKKGAVIPLFILDPHLMAANAPRRQGFLFEGLRNLDASLRQRGSRLVIRKGEPAEELRKLLGETGAENIFAEEDFTPHARRRDAIVARDLPLRLLKGQTVHHPLEVLKPDGSPYVVFTPYSKKWKASLGGITLLPAPERIETPAGIQSEPLHASRPLAGFPVGELEAEVRLEEFMHRKILDYQTDRHRLDLEGTSSLSPYIHFGMLGLRQAAAAALQSASSDAWLNELIWREFYIQILYHFPHVRGGSFDASLSEVEWREDLSDFEAWKQGRTGVPIVDAAMRQLRRTGWMHNRARMIAASYLVKDLLINWQWGERY